MRQTIRIASFALGAAAMALAGGAAAQIGVPAGIDVIRKPTGTTCRTVSTRMETRADAACGEGRRRAVEIDERECSRMRDGHLEALFTDLEERPRGCVAAADAPS